MAKKPFDPILNIKNEMKNADMRNFKFYSELDDERKKRMGSPFPIMRWMSNVRTYDPRVLEYYLVSVNEIANVGFWELYKHPELQWQLIAACGLGKPMIHDWISAPKRQMSGKIDQLLLKLNPNMNKMEVDCVKRKLTKDSLKKICRGFGYTDTETKPYLDEFKKIKM